MQKTIYISNEGIWESIKDSAKFENRSVSNYLVQLHQIRESVKTIVMQNGSEITFSGEGEKHEGHPDSIPEEVVAPPGDIMEKQLKIEKVKKQLAKVIKEKKSDWVNPLSNSVLAPKG